MQRVKSRSLVQIVCILGGGRDASFTVRLPVLAHCSLELELASDKAVVLKAFWVLQLTSGGLRQLRPFCGSSFNLSRGHLPLCPVCSTLVVSWAPLASQVWQAVHDCWRSDGGQNCCSMYAVVDWEQLARIKAASPRLAFGDIKEAAFG